MKFTQSLLSVLLAGVAPLVSAQNLAAVAVADGELTTLVAAATATGQAADLTGEDELSK
jgi:hypothetical protein